jgi:hypothetical protein
MYYSAFRRRSRAQKRGQRMGRKPKLTETQQDEARRRRAEGATLAELARSYGVKRVRFPGSPRFCVRARQATAEPAQYFRAPGRPAPQVKNAPRAVVTLAAPGSYFVKPWPGFP